jgi:hypothetical protein
MVIALTGWCHDRYPGVASAMLIEVGLSPVGGVFRYGGFEPYEDISDAQIAAIAGYFAPMTLDEAKAAKIAEIQAASNAAIAMLESGYTQGEVKSFDRQRQGALDILAENTTTADAQYVAALAAARAAAGEADCTTAWLAQRIKDNADTAAAYTIAILGKQQGLEVRVRAAQTVLDLEAVTW